VELLVVEKSRRVGITWAFAGDDVITSATARGEGGDDTLYISYSQDMAREYIDACAGFAKAFMGIDAQVGEFMFDDEDPASGEAKGIKAFRISFASGFEIQALSSAPRSLRGKQGRVRIDEGAFVNNLDELLKAAMALTVLGGSVVVMSSHNGADNPFNLLIQAIRAEERAGQVLTITFADAIADGMYERVAKIRGLPLTAEAAAEWEGKIRKLYGSAAAEELDCIPSKGSGAWLSYDQIERAEREASRSCAWLRRRLRHAGPTTCAPPPSRSGARRTCCRCCSSCRPTTVVGVGGDFARISTCR
jgi:phage FluMu gp28-like protein